MIPDFWHRVGCVDASLENFESLLADNQEVLIFPEGVEGIGKGFEKRYQIQSDFQYQLTKKVESFGEDPYSFQELIDKLTLDPILGMYLIPFNWPILMTALVREFEKGNLLELKFSPGEFIRISLHHLDAYAFSLPFSWLSILSENQYKPSDFWNGLSKRMESEFHLKGEEHHGLHKSAELFAKY